jgi:hypothetical protein
MSSKKSKNDVAWEDLFHRYNILEHIAREGKFEISAKTINEVREARLMTKFDHAINLPSIFRSNKLNILPISRSAYVIGHFDCYKELPTLDTFEVSDATLDCSIESISPDDLYSEVAALLCAQHAGLVSDVLDEDVLLTVFGRMTTGVFDFKINAAAKGDQSQAVWLSISNAQIEIDGGYESGNKFAIFESKNQRVSDFNIRQLYYPYRFWSNILSKPVTPIFFTYSNEVFSFFVYKFSDPKDFNSIELAYHKHYKLVPNEIQMGDVRRVLEKTRIVSEPKEPFPQADVFERVIDLMVQLSAKETLTQDEITTNYAFDVRQSQYYCSAAQYLGLVDRKLIHGEGVSYALSELGAKVMKKPPTSRNLSLAEIVLSRRIFRQALKFYLDNSRQPTKKDVIGWMKKAGLKINPTTRGRRASTVIGWVRWIMSLTVNP